MIWSIALYNYKNKYFRLDKFEVNGFNSYPWTLKLGLIFYLSFVLFESFFEFTSLTIPPSLLELLKKSCNCHCKVWIMAKASRFFVQQKKKSYRMYSLKQLFRSYWQVCSFHRCIIMKPGTWHECNCELVM